MKIMLIAFFDSAGLIYHKFVSPGQTCLINSIFYLEDFEMPSESNKNRVRRDFIAFGNWILFHWRQRASSFCFYCIKMGCRTAEHLWLIVASFHRFHRFLLRKFISFADSADTCVCTCTYTYKNLVKLI